MGWFEGLRGDRLTRVSHAIAALGFAIYRLPARCQPRSHEGHFRQFLAVVAAATDGDAVRKGAVFILTRQSSRYNGLGHEFMRLLTVARCTSSGEPWFARPS